MRKELSTKKEQAKTSSVKENKTTAVKYQHSVLNRKRMIIANKAKKRR